jgi:hypothetical protein
MANQFLTNQTPATFAYCMYDLMKVMNQAGWSIMAWSDGTTVHNTGTIPGPYQQGAGSPDPVFPLTGAFPNTGAGGAGGLDNSRAWFVVRQPPGTGSAQPGNSVAAPYGGNRMLVFQRTTSDDLSWRIKYSVGPTSGHASQYQFASNATTTPSLFNTAAQDEVLLIGGGSDASPTFTLCFINAQRGTSRFHSMANDGLTFEVAPFGVWCAVWNAGAGFFPMFGFIFEPLQPGTTAPGEPEPYVIGVDENQSVSSQNGCFVLSIGNAASTFFTQAGNGGSAGSWFRYGQSNQTFQRLCPLTFSYIDVSLGVVNTVPGMSFRGNPLSTNPINSDDDLFPIAYGRPASFGGIGGYKGVGSMMKWNSAVRATGDTQAQATVRDRIIIGVVSVPWDGSVPTL